MALTLVPTSVDRVVRDALAEDVGSGDVTTNSLFAAGATARAALLLKEPGVVSGLAVAEHVFRVLDPSTRFEALVSDGDRVERAPVVLARIEGATRALLTGERTALNLLGRLSGIATLTRAYVDAVEGTRAVILDTRKTAPGLRALEKTAVRHGGGTNHRLGLFDAILVKDNHLLLAGGIRAALEVLRAAVPDRPIEVETESLEDVREALAAGAERILLDNMSPDLMSAAVALVAGRAALEASGGVTLGTVRAVAETGVDAISVGALTHSARSLDVSMEVSP
jgi:nicotinate-nucleotide pyrophosphorylase (carboxylating)